MKEKQKRIVDPALDAGSEPQPDYAWKGKPFQAYIGQYMAGALEKMEGKQTCFVDLQNGITMQAWTRIGKEGEAKAFIREYFDEAADTHTWLKDLEGLEEYADIDLFNTPNTFQSCMIQKGIEDLVEASGILEASDSDLMQEFVLDRETIEDLKGTLDLAANSAGSLHKGKGKEAGVFLDPEAGMELEVE